MSTRPVVLGAIALALLFVSLAPSLLHAQERVRIGVSSRGFGSLPIFVADKKGFYTKYNLHSEMILLRSSVAVPALLSGDLDYYNGFQPVISAALKGIPIKLVMMSAEKVIFLVLVKPDVKSIHDLKGKTIGVSAAGSTIHLSLLSILNRFRLDPAKDVRILPAGDVRSQLAALQSEKIDALINDTLLEKEATKRKLTVPALLDSEVTAKVGLITEQKIENFCQNNKAQIKGEQAQLREQLRAFLQNQKLAAKREELLRSLRAQAKVVVNLKAPPIQRVEVSVQGAPFKGGDKVPVTIVEFSDFHCAFCRRVVSTLAQLESQYGEKIKLVFRDFPIENLHPGATKAHEAARCANEQGKFWPYHDKLFAGPAKSSPELFNGFAKEIGLNAAAFDSCLGSGKHQAAIKKDIEEGQRVGVTGTPAFFINGRLVTGAQPLEAFARVIDDELARAARSAQK